MQGHLDARSLNWSRPAFFVLAEGLRRECSETASIAIAAVIGLAYAAMLFGFSGVFGTSPFWDLPVGYMGGPLDIRNSLAGYWWFIQDSWRWPLLSLPNANWPEGTNAEMFDITPLVAIAGKLLHTLSGRSVNLYPEWVAGCFAMNAAALTALVRALGNRSLLAAIVAAGLGAMAPVVQFRFGHMALMAHWLPVFALALYFHAKPLPFTGRVVAAFFLLTLLAAGTHLYLYVMTAAIAAGAAVQAILDRRATAATAAIALVLFLLGGIIPLWSFGLLGKGLMGVQRYGFGVYSMNLMSMFWPQSSGLFHWTGIYYLTRGSIGGTVGQYDGYDYLGGGVLFLLAICLWNVRWRIVPMLRGHIGLIAMLAVLVLWAASNKIYLGPYRILSYPVPRFLDQTLLSWFRSSGRFIWPMGWLLSGIAIAGALPARRKWVVALGAAALLLQWTDVAPWREKIAAYLHRPPVSVFGSRENAMRVAQKIKRAGAVAVVPAVFCSSARADYDSPLNAAALEIQVAAARANARMPTVYLSRQKVHCEKSLNLRPAVMVMLKDKAASPYKPVALHGNCEDFPNATVCVTGSK